MRLTPALASRFGRAAFAHVEREYPHRLDHVIDDAAASLSPRALHPIFFGSYDWHSCVHGWWLLLSIARLYPAMPLAAMIRERAAATFTPANVEAEVAYMLQPSARGFERPYGWAWLLSLHREAARQRTSWSNALEPLARVIAWRLRDYLSLATYPVRGGGPGNTAFATILAHGWAVEHDPELAAALTATARRWYGGDRDAVAWEPDGEAFLSPVLTEAHCMLRVLPYREFEDWFAAFLPRFDRAEPAALFVPAVVSDRGDGRIVHLDGLNLSRAWTLRTIGRLLPLGHIVHNAGEAHLAAAMPHVTGDYVGEHWLASFALLALLPESF
jgi:hypothetical protein